VLDLHVTEAVESLLVGTIEQAEGVEEPEGALGADLTLEGLEIGGGLAGLGGGEGGGRADKSEGNKLHHCECFGFGQLVAFIGVLEVGVMKDLEGTGNEFAGDFRNGALDFGWDKFDEKTKLRKRGIELNNGRAAMMGILGLMVHEQLGGSLPIVGAL